MNAPAAVSNPFLTAALRYAALRLRVTPLHGKKPFLDDWHAQATTDESVIRGLWRRNPKANVGIVTGAASGIFVVDVDPRHGGEESLDSMILKHGPLPDTWQQNTPTGGRHIVFRHPGFEVPTRAGVLPGIDIRGDNNGQIVAEPSIHPDVKKPYHWDGLKEIEEQPIAPAPAWVLELIKRTQHSPQQSAAPIPEKIPHGRQHDTLVSLAGTLWRRGLDVALIESTLWEVNQARCERPGTRDHIRQISQSMEKYSREAKTNLLAIDRRTPEPPPQKKRLVDIDALEVFKADYEEPAFVVPEFLSKGVTLFCGRPKVGKSWLALQIAVSVAAGERLFGRFPVERAGRVVYLALEEPKRRTSARLKKVFSGNPVFLQNIRLIYQIEPLLAGGAAQLDDYLLANPAELVVIDTLLAVLQASGGRDVLRSEYNEANVLRELADKHKTAFLIVHHQRKAGAEFHIDQVAGTTGLTAGADAIWNLNRKPGGEAVLELTGREMEEKTFGLKLMTGAQFGWQLQGEGAEVALSDERREILTLLKDESPLKPAKIALLLKKNANTVRVLLHRLLNEGFVQKNSHGEYLLSHIPVNAVNSVNGEAE